MSWDAHAKPLDGIEHAKPRTQGEDILTGILENWNIQQ